MPKQIRHDKHKCFFYQPKIEVVKEAFNI